MKKRAIFAAVAVFILLSCVSCGDKPINGQTDTPHFLQLHLRFEPSGKSE